MSRWWMSRPYALGRLLEHGALTGEQLREITGWDAHDVGLTLQRLMADGTVAFTNLQGRRHYLLARTLADAKLSRRPPDLRDPHAPRNSFTC